MYFGNAVGRQQPLASRPRGLHLAWTFAVAYLLVIAYASLQPFSGWWTPPEEIRRFLTAAWPRYITLDDVLINIAAYVPLGFLVARALMRSMRNTRAVLLAAALTAAMSVAMETAQAFMPSRVASNVDVLTNSIGGLIGALAAPLFSPTRLLGSRLARLRRSWFAYGQGADVGLALLCVWLVTQLDPTAQLFATGDLRNTFNIRASLIHTPTLLFMTEAAVAGLNVLALGLTAIALTRHTMPRATPLVVLLAAAFSAKVLVAMAVAKSAGPFAWLTPGVAAGLLVAGVLVYAISHLARRAQWIVAALAFALAVATINLAPDNPYQSVPAKLLAGPTHFLSFSAIVRALSELWPFLAIAYTMAAAYDERPRH